MTSKDKPVSSEMVSTAIPFESIALAISALVSGQDHLMDKLAIMR